MFKKLFKVSLINLFIISCFNFVNNSSIVPEIAVERGLYSKIRPTVVIEKIPEGKDKRILKGEKAIFELKDAKEIKSINNSSIKGQKNKITNINKNRFIYEAIFEGCDDLEIIYIDNYGDEIKGYTYIPIATEAEITFVVYLAGDNNLNGGSFSYNVTSDMVLKDLSEIQNAYIDKKALNVMIYLDITDEALKEYKKSKNSILSTGFYKLIDGKLVLQKTLPEDDNYITRSDRINTGSKETLKDCLNTAYSLSKSKKVILEIWGHGNSLAGVGFDDDRINRGDGLNLEELKEAIKESNLKKVDILNFSACLMMGIEVFYELRECAGYISGSSEFVPGDGSYYGSSKGILTWISKNYSAPSKEIALEMSRLNFESYLNGGAQYISGSEYEYFLSYSTVDLTQMNDHFINNLKILFNNLQLEQLESVRKDLLYHGKNINPSKEITEYFDFIDFLNKLEDKGLLINEIANLKNSLKNFLIFNENINIKYSGALKSGFSIFYQPSLLGNRYDNSSNFGKDTGWNKFLLRKN